MKEIDNLIAVSRKYGADSRFVIAGGGNTSYKDATHLWVKASGHALATIDEEGFAVMDRVRLDAMATKTYPADATEREARVKEDLADANLTRGRRPSVETSLHNCMNFSYVVHLHPTLVNGLMCSVTAEKRCAELFPDALYVAYTDPGYTLFKKVYDAIGQWKAQRGSEPQVIFLQNHGIFVAADTVAEIDAIYEDVMTKLEALVAPLPEGETPVCDCVSEVLPAIRQILSRGGRGLKTLQVTKNALVDEFLANPKGVLTPFSPDGIVYCKSEYIVIDSDDKAAEAEEKIEAYVTRRGHTPKVLLIKGIGLVAVGDNAKNARVITEVFLDAMKVAFYARSFGGEHGMEPAWIDFIDNWEVENYRRTVGAGGAHGRVEGKTIIVTGAAQGFGEGIARELMKEGANIVVADLNEVTGEKTAASFNELARSNRAIFVKTNVADMDSLNNLIKTTICNFGALDTFVSNAGVVRAGDLEAMTPENLEFVTKINYSAYFYCAKVAQHVMKLQTAADPDYFADIVQVNSKSGLVGSKANFAYAGSKFGGIGLTQSFALRPHPILRPGTGPLPHQGEQHLPGQLPGRTAVERPGEGPVCPIPPCRQSTRRQDGGRRERVLPVQGAHAQGLQPGGCDQGHPLCH